MFVGTFEHSLDDKGRLVLPATFRSALGERGFLSQYDRCLGLWTEEGFNHVAHRLREKVRDGSAAPNAVRSLTANASEVKLDSQGRITISPRLRDYADLTSNSVIIGAFDRIEIWDVARWEEVSADADDSLLVAVTSLGI